MQVTNYSDNPIQVLMTGRKPITYNREELVFPPRSLTLQPGEPVQLSDQDGAIVLERFGVQGIVTPKDGETPDVTRRRARKMRYDYLMGRIRHFRSLQAQKSATGAVVDIPPDHIRDTIPEINRLREELTQNDPLMAQVLGIAGAAPVQDPVAAELLAVGLPGNMAPAAPGIPDALSGMTGVG